MHTIPNLFCFDLRFNYPLRMSLVQYITTIAISVLIFQMCTDQEAARQESYTEVPESCNRHLSRPESSSCREDHSTQVATEGCAYEPGWRGWGRKCKSLQLLYTRLSVSIEPWTRDLVCCMLYSHGVRCEQEDEFEIDKVVMLSAICSWSVNFSLPISTHVTMSLSYLELSSS